MGTAKPKPGKERTQSYDEIDYASFLNFVVQGNMITISTRPRSSFKCKMCMKKTIQHKCVDFVTHIEDVSGNEIGVRHHVGGPKGCSVYRHFEKYHKGMITLWTLGRI